MSLTTSLRRLPWGANKALDRKVLYKWVSSLVGNILWRNWPSFKGTRKMAGIGGPPAERQAVFYWIQHFTEQVSHCSPKTRIIEDNFPTSSSIELFAISGYVEWGQQWVKDKKEGHCQQRSGWHTPDTVTAAKAQRATVCDRKAKGLDSDTFLSLCITHPGRWSLVI